MLLIGLARIGKDPAIRYTGDGKPVMDLSLAMDYGKKGADGQQQRTVRRQASQSACCKRGNPLASADGMDRRVGSASTARKRS